jgi:hypothetical protein
LAVGLSLSHHFLIQGALRAFVGFRWQPFSFWICGLRLRVFAVGREFSRLTAKQNRKLRAVS